MENITKQEATRALVELNKLSSNKLINRDTFDILVRCVANIIELQNFGETPLKKEKVKVDINNLPDCNKCGDYEYCAFKYDECTGFIPGGEALSEKLAGHKIEMVPDSAPVVVPQKKNEDIFKNF